MILILLYQFIFISLKSKNFYNINVKKIEFEFTYKRNSNIKVLLFTYNKITIKVDFEAYLKSEDTKNKLLIKCYNINIYTIQCDLKKNIIINYKVKYYFFYECNNCNLLINNKNIYKDQNNISLIFMPQVFNNQILYTNQKKFLVKKNINMINSGYLFIARKSKKILKNPKDGFNKYIELNNYISSYNQKYDYRSLLSYKEAIRRGFHIVDADIQFTKDKIPIICHSSKLEKISNGEGIISEKTLEELKKLYFFNDKYKREKILTFEELLKLCKEENIIIDLDLYHINYNEYFKNTDEYVKIIINIIKKYIIILFPFLYNILYREIELNFNIAISL